MNRRNKSTKVFGFFSLFLIFLGMIFLAAAVRASENYPLLKNSLNVCSRSVDIFNYQMNPFQDVNTSFIVQKDQVLFFIRELPKNFEVKVNGIKKNLNLSFESQSLFHVTVYSLNTVPGSNVSISSGECFYHGYEWDSRCIQAYIVQDSEKPLYNLSDMKIVYENFSQIYPQDSGNYNFFVFDKYSEDFPGKGSDFRYLNLTINSSTQIFKESFIQPGPVPIEGIVLVNFSLTLRGNVSYTMKTNDSTYWFNISCPNLEPLPNPFCGDGSCNSGETCSNCPQDCGKCYSGGGGCGSTVSYDYCLPDWSCTSWGGCLGGVKSRDCVDLNHCGSDLDKPTESIGCFESSNQTATSLSPKIEGASIFESNTLFVALVFSIVLLVILIGLVLYRAFKGD